MPEPATLLELRREPARLDDLAVVHATDTFLPTMNGVVRSVANAAAGLRSRGARVDVLAPRARGTGGATRGLWSVPFGVYPGLRLALAPVRRRDVAGIDAVHMHTPGPVGLGAARRARRAGVRVVYTHHTRYEQAIELFAPRPLRRALLRAYERGAARLLPKADVVLAPTPAIAEELSERYDIDARALPTGLDDGFADAARAAAKDRVEDGAFRVLTVGRLAPEKNLDTLLRAFRHVAERVPRARLALAGEGPHEASLRRLAAQLGIEERVEWLGFVPEARLARVYASASVFAMTSKYETQGLTLTEAAAASRRIVCPALPVFDGLVRAGAAVACDPDHAGSVAEAILAAAADPSLPAAALAYADDLRASRLVDELAAVYSP